MSLDLLIPLLNALGAGLLLFLLGAGLTLIFGLMGVLNFAHAAFYMLGAYLGWQLTAALGFWPALVLAPLAVGLLGAAVEAGLLRRARPQGHVAELLLTFGLALLLVELVQLAWGRQPLAGIEAPALLRGPGLTLRQSAQHGLELFAGAGPAGGCRPLAEDPGLHCVRYPAARLFLMGTAVALLAALALLLRRSRTGFVIRAALTHPDMVMALGHELPALQCRVFGAGCALAALAGVVGGLNFVVEPAMAATMGSILFVAVVVGGLGSLAGAFLGSLLAGALQVLPLQSDASLQGLLARWQLAPDWPAGHPLHDLLHLTLAQAAPVLPYLLLVAVLPWRPRGLLGTRDL